MTPHAIIAYFAAREVQLWAEGDRLGYRYRPGALSDSDREIIKANQLEILASLQQSQVSPAPGAIQAAPHALPTSAFDGQYWRPDPSWSIADRQRWGDRANE